MVGVGGHGQLGSGQVLVIGNGGGISRRVLRGLERYEKVENVWMRCWRHVAPNHRIGVQELELNLIWCVAQQSEKINPAINKGMKN